MVAEEIKSSLSKVVNTAKAALHAKGLPPKVEPCVPAVNISAALPRAKQAPIGTTLPKALAKVQTSGMLVLCCWA